MSNTKRDLFFLVLLIIMVKIAVDQQINQRDLRVYTHSEISRAMTSPMSSEISGQNNNESIASAELGIATLSAIKAKPSDHQDNILITEQEKSFEIHEPNYNTLQQIDLAYEHIQQLLAFLKPTSKKTAKLHSMQQRLALLKRKYKSTSPAIALLGPIGTAGIVLKENELEKNLLCLVNMTGSILQELLDNTQRELSYASINQGIQQNTLLLASLQKHS